MSRFSAILLACAVLIVPATGHSVTWHVPTQCPTIQAGIDSASAGDTVLVACGTYYEDDIVMKSGICLRSETGQESGRRSSVCTTWGTCCHTRKARRGR